jgi:hypothetical protein
MCDEPRTIGKFVFTPPHASESGSHTRLRAQAMKTPTKSAGVFLVSALQAGGADLSVYKRGGV